jgi:hypothetical protein
MKNIISVFVLLTILFCIGCAGVSSKNNKEKHTNSIKNIEEFPSIPFNAPNGNVMSPIVGKIINNPLSADAQSIFGNNIVFNNNINYVFYGKENTADYFIMIYNFNKTIENTTDIEMGDIIGKSLTSDPLLLVFCKTLDPYLIVNCRNKPFYYEGFYWFEGAFLFPNGNTNWFSFNPVDNRDDPFVQVAKHVVSEAPGLNFYPNTIRLRLKINLTEYPRQLTQNEKQRLTTVENWYYRRNDILSHVSEFYVGEYKYFLCWQRGFDQYIAKEYQLNNDIWIYGALVSYSVWDERGYFFIRDFSLASLEEEYETRIKLINNQ